MFVYLPPEDAREHKRAKPRPELTTQIVSAPFYSVQAAMYYPQRFYISAQIAEPADQYTEQWRIFEEVVLAPCLTGPSRNSGPIGSPYHPPRTRPGPLSSMPTPTPTLCYISIILVLRNLSQDHSRPQIHNREFQPIRLKHMTRTQRIRINIRLAMGMEER